MSDPHFPTQDDKQRVLGKAAAGQVGIRNFDEGVVQTLGAEIYDIQTGKGFTSNYFIATDKIQPVRPAPGLPGIPITFSHPEDIWERYRQPVIVIRRDDISPSMSRWHPGMVTYRTPAEGANPVEVTLPTGNTVQGFDRYEQKQQAVPFDLTYTITILARYRGKGPIPPKDTPTGFKGAEGSPRNQVNRILDYCLRIYAPYAQVFVRDSLGDRRKYSAFMEAVSHLDEVPEITERVLGFALTLRVEAELDLSDPTTHRAVTTPLTVRSEVL